MIHTILILWQILTIFTIALKMTILCQKKLGLAKVRMSTNPKSLPKSIPKEISPPLEATQKMEESCGKIEEAKEEKTEKMERSQENEEKSKNRTNPSADNEKSQSTAAPTE